MMSRIIEGHALPKSWGSPPLDIQLSRRCFFSRASSSRASRKRSSSFRRAKSSSQARLFSACSLSHLICSSMPIVCLLLIRRGTNNYKRCLFPLFRISMAFLHYLATRSLHLVLLGWVLLGAEAYAPLSSRGHARERA